MYSVTVIKVATGHVDETGVSEFYGSFTGIQAPKRFSKSTDL